MPIYEYRCEYCGHKFQVLQKVNDPAPEVCPNCNRKGGIKKLISETMFELKGTGWYVTDYKNSSSNKETGKSESKASDKKTETKEAKSA